MVILCWACCGLDGNFIEIFTSLFSGPVSIVPKKTSLHDFKKLLAQQSLGQNPHRISAKELLDKSALGTGGNSQEPIYNYSSSQTKLGGRSKRSSPWVDKRFSVIQEENEGSKENLIE